MPTTQTGKQELWPTFTENELDAVECFQMGFTMESMPELADVSPDWDIDRFGDRLVVVLFEPWVCERHGYHYDPRAGERCEYCSEEMAQDAEMRG